MAGRARSRPQVRFESMRLRLDSDRAITAHNKPLSAMHICSAHVHPAEQMDMATLRHKGSACMCLGSCAFARKRCVDLRHPGGVCRCPRTDVHFLFRQNRRSSVPANFGIVVTMILHFKHFTTFAIKQIRMASHSENVCIMDYEILVQQRNCRYKL